LNAKNILVAAGNKGKTCASPSYKELSNNSKSQAIHTPIKLAPSLDLSQFPASLPASHRLVRRSFLRSLGFDGVLLALARLFSAPPQNQ